jgi:hypothetical protein
MIPIEAFPGRRWAQHQPEAATMEQQLHQKFKLVAHQLVVTPDESKS